MTETARRYASGEPGAPGVYRLMGHDGWSARREARPRTLGRLAHLVAVTDARLLVAERRPEAVWRSERLLARERVRAGERRSHLPDAEVVIDGARVCVEVELTPKERLRTEAIVRELL